MKRVVIQREETGNAGTFGTLTVDALILRTGELPWRDNKPGVSCVPPGVYRVEWEYSDHFDRNLFELKGVPGRSECKLHVANFCGDTALGLKSDINGCIALGRGVGDMQGQRALLSSRSAMKLFEQHMGVEPFDLEVRDVEYLEPS